MSVGVGTGRAARRAGRHSSWLGPAERRHQQEIGALALAVVLALASAAIVLVTMPGTSVPAAQAPPPVPAPPAVPPLVLTATVHDAGPAGLTLRSEPSADPSTARGTVPDGTPLPVVCGVTGPSLSRAGEQSATWLRTADARYAPALYARVADRSVIVPCLPGQMDLALPPAGPADRSDEASSAAAARGSRRSPTTRRACSTCTSRTPAGTARRAASGGMSDSGTAAGSGGSGSSSGSAPDAGTANDQSDDADRGVDLGDLLPLDDLPAR